MFTISKARMHGMWLVALKKINRKRNRAQLQHIVRFPEGKKGQKQLKVHGLGTCYALCRHKA